MGATTFFNTADKSHYKSANDAFYSAKENAQYEHGHGGYSGTIAEKDGFRIVNPPTGMSVRDFIRAIEDYDGESSDVNPTVREAWKIYDDKWGPALCIETNDEYIFCGWASE